ncbi:MAG: hypothetical protein K9K81_11125 [Desulfobacteraceae bacterium]|nr:hypothetical protein [Desulfobacteraceae bacterium]
MVHSGRIHHLIAVPQQSGKYIQYWMQQTRCTGSNHASNYAAERANGFGLPLVAGHVISMAAGVGYL